MYAFALNKNFYPRALLPALGFRPLFLQNPISRFPVTSAQWFLSIDYWSNFLQKGAQHLALPNSSRNKAEFCITYLPFLACQTQEASLSQAPPYPPIYPLLAERNHLHEISVFHLSSSSR